jgi:alkylated DNA repair dioxygenase AlkB
MSKKVYDPNIDWQFTNEKGEILAAYIPNNTIDDISLWSELMKVPFTRVIYISKYGKINRTPRLTWAYGQVNANMPNSLFVDPQTQSKTTLRVIPNPDVANTPDITNYRNLDFQSEVMPPWLESLSQYCRQLSIMNWGFDPAYNSAIIGRYDDGDDSIGFHTDDQCFLTHNFCANVTLGMPRDFQFKTGGNGEIKQTHEIKLAHKSVFFFNGLEHALPVRKGTPNGYIRFSVSFRNMKNNIGIGNSFYYSRGLAGAVDNEAKQIYIKQVADMIEEK